MKKHSSRTTSPFRRTPRLAPVVIVMLGAMVSLWGCSSPSRPNLTAAQLDERAKLDALQAQETIKNAVQSMFERVNREAESGEAQQTIDYLALTGGGDFGAFGAGFLVGWGESADPNYRRPDFDAVTGVSTGAMLAPFAYVGTDEACLQIENFYRNPKKDWLHRRGLLFFLPSNASFMTIPGLERDIKAAINKPFVEKLAEESRKGKLLVISATNLDLGRQKFWNVGAEAEAGVAGGNIDRIEQIMRASSAIPAVFPPVLIDGWLYADGGVTANVFLRLDPDSPGSFIRRWIQEHPDRPLPKLRFWVIVNNQLAQAPQVVQERWPAVAGPSLGTSIRSATVAEIRWLTAQADYVNSVWKTDVEVRVVAIPNDWRAPVKGDFKKETMDSLADLGRKLGADPNSWMLWAAPKGKTPDFGAPVGVD